MILVTALAIGCSSCASTPRLADTSMCEHLDSWAKTVSASQSSTVKLIRGGTWMVNHYKSCEHSDGDGAAGVFCEWLMENTSTEFMESNINRSMTCLQGQRIAGASGNTGIESWSGKATFYSPQLATADVEIDLEYSLDNSKESREDFLQFTVRAR